MKKTLLCLLLSTIFLTTSVSAAEQTFFYQTHNPRSKKVNEEFTLKVLKLEDGQTQINRTLKTPQYTKYAEMIVNTEYDTLKFTTKRTDADTEYKGAKNGTTLTLTGKLEGEALNRTIELDEKPFYFTPKFNLTHFVLSGKKEIQFWTLRKDQLTEYLMEAANDGETTVEVDGVEIPAIKIKYSATGKAARFYRRTYYFRKSDGLFIKKKSPDGTISELMQNKS